LAHSNTTFVQVLKLVPRHEFETLAKTHHVGRKLRKTSRWSQYVALCLGQFAGRHRLRNIESSMKAQTHRLYHLGAIPLARSSFARLNETHENRNLSKSANLGTVCLFRVPALGTTLKIHRREARLFYKKEEKQKLALYFMGLVYLQSR
jgi:hypothetical protein